MTRKKTNSKSRNWAVVIIGSIMIIAGLFLVVIAITNVSTLGWWALAVGLSGLSMAGVATIAIIENDPAWILLDLILPG